MKDISNDFRVNDNNENNNKNELQKMNKNEKEEAKRLRAVQKQMREVFDGNLVDELFLTIYNNGRSEDEKSFIADAVIMASMEVMSSQAVGEAKEMERYNAFKDILGGYGLEVETGSWTLTKMQAQVNLVTLDLDTYYDYDMDKKFRQVRKQVNFLNTDIIQEANQRAQELVNKDEISPVFFKESTSSKEDDDRVVFVTRSVITWLLALSEKVELNNRKTSFVETVITYVRDDLEFNSTPYKSVKAGAQTETYDDSKLNYCLEGIKERAVVMLHEAFDKLYEKAGITNVPPLFKNGKYVYKKDKEPLEVRVLRGNKYDVYREFEDVRFFCKLVGVEGDM